MLDQYKTLMRDGLTTMKVYDEEEVKQRHRKECDETTSSYAPMEEGTIMFNQHGERVYLRKL